MRRVVTGHTPDGKAVVVSDTEVDAVVPGGNIYMLYGGLTKHRHFQMMGRHVPIQPSSLPSEGSGLV